MTTKTKVITLMTVLEVTGFVGVCFAIRVLDTFAGRLVLATLWVLLFAKRLRRYMS